MKYFLYLPLRCYPPPMQTWKMKDHHIIVAVGESLGFTFKSEQVKTIPALFLARIYLLFYLQALETEYICYGVLPMTLESIPCIIKSNCS